MASKEAGVEPTVFEVDKHETTHKKELVRLCEGDTFSAHVQLVTKGGANNLHSHTYTEGFWMVLRGRAKFYTGDDEVIADLEADEGIHIPRTYPYWFEPAGDETLEILHISVYAEGEKRERVDLSNRKDWMEGRDLGSGSPEED